MVDGRLLQGVEQGAGLPPLHQTRAQGAGHVLDRRLHRVEVVERGQVKAIGKALGDGPRHAHALAPQPQMAVTEAATVQRRAVTVDPAFHDVMAAAGWFTGELVRRWGVIPVGGRRSGGFGLRLDRGGGF